MAPRKAKDLGERITEMLESVVADVWVDEDGDPVFREGRAVVSVTVDETLDWPVIVLSAITNTQLPRIGALYKYAAEHAFDRRFTALTVATEPGEPFADLILGWEILAPTLEPDVFAWAVGFFAGQANDVADEVHTLFGGELPGSEMVLDGPADEEIAELDPLSDRDRKRWRNHLAHIERRLTRFLARPTGAEFLIVEVEGDDNVYLQFVPADDGLSIRYEAVGEANVLDPDTVARGLGRRLVACGWTAPADGAGAGDGGNYHRYLPLPLDVAAVAEDVAFTLQTTYRKKPGCRLAIRAARGRTTRS